MKRTSCIELSQKFTIFETALSEMMGFFVLYNALFNRINT